MIIKKLSKNLIFTAGVSLVVSCSSVAYAMPGGEPISPARAMEVTVIKGEKLSALLGKSSKNYSVMAMVDGSLQAIPYQFDDVNLRGFVFTPGGKLEIDGEEDIIEAQDELALMYKDTGPLAEQELLASQEGKVLAELVFSDAGHVSYAYVFEGNSQRSDKKYTHFNKETGLVKTSAYSLQVDPDNLLQWSDYHYEGFTNSQSILDNMKLRVHAKMGFFKATIHNGLIPNRIVAIKNGAVRTVIEMDAGLSVFGIQLATAGASVVVTENTTEFPVYITIPAAAGIIADKLVVDISLDFNDLEGMLTRTQLGPKEPLVAGSKKGNPEDYKVDLEHSWLSASSTKNWDIVAIFKRDPNFVATLNTLYKDNVRGDEPDSPERMEGSFPQVGYIATNIPAGIDTFLGIDLYYSPDFWQGNNVEKSIYEIQNHIVPSVNSL